MNSSVLTASLTGRIQFFYDVALLRTSTAHLRLRLVVNPSPLWPYCDLEAGPHRGANLTRGVNEGRGYEPPGAFAPFTPTSVCCALPAVVVRKAARRWRCPTRARRFRTPEIPIPHRNLSPPRICELHRPHPVSERCTMQSACQYPPRRASARAMPTDHSRATS